MMQSEDWLRIAYLIAAFLVPLLPALAIYKSLPSQSDVTGPFQGLTIKLSGAFGGYFLLVLLSFGYAYFVLAPGEVTFEVWEVTGTILPTDEDGNTTGTVGTTLTVQPSNFIIDSEGTFTATVLVKPGHVKGRRIFPQLHFGKAGHTVSILGVSENHAEMDEKNKRAILKKAVEIKTLPKMSQQPTWKR